MTLYIKIIFLNAYNAIFILNILFLILRILNILKDGSMVNYFIKSYVNQHKIDVFSYIYDFPIDITYM